MHCNSFLLLHVCALPEWDGLALACSNINMRINFTQVAAIFTTIIILQLLFVFKDGHAKAMILNLVDLIRTYMYALGQIHRQNIV